jgi:formiminoglutamase
MNVVTVAPGQGPVIIAIPHTGEDFPPEIYRRLNATGRKLQDTDWFVDQIYRDILSDATYVRCLVHRYVIDVNRDPSGASLYPGQATTGLVPHTDFQGEPIWTEPPDDADVARQVRGVHQPYHAALRAEIARVRDKHGVAVLWDAHSIRSQLPFLFDGVLPDLNIGTDGGRTCDAELQAAVARIAETSGRSWVLNGRFRGGWTTRHYGRPQEGCHAIQMELAQSAYGRETNDGLAFSAAGIARIRPILRSMLDAIVDLAPTLKVPR